MSDPWRPLAMIAYDLFGTFLDSGRVSTKSIRDFLNLVDGQAAVSKREQTQEEALLVVLDYALEQEQWSDEVRTRVLELVPGFVGQTPRSLAVDKTVINMLSSLKIAQPWVQMSRDVYQPLSQTAWVRSAYGRSDVQCAIVAPQRAPMGGQEWAICIMNEVVQGTCSTSEAALKVADQHLSALGWVLLEVPPSLPIPLHLP